MNTPPAQHLLFMNSLVLMPAEKRVPEFRIFLLHIERRGSAVLQFKPLATKCVILRQEDGLRWAEVVYSIPTPSMRYLSLLALVVLATNAFAQYTPLKYNFRPTPDVAANIHMFDGQPDPQSNNYRMQSLAANGFGQWGVDMSGVANTRWVLWGNSQSDLVTSNTSRVIPTGVVASGTMTDNSSNDPNWAAPSDLVRVAANLKGTVRYVWYNGTRWGSPTRWIIEGFDKVDMNMTFPSIPKPATTRSATLSPIRAYGSVVQNINNTGTLDWVDGATEEKDQDVFDIACDAKFLYIAFESSTGTYVDVYNLSDGTEVTGWPQFYGGIRPTIACDVRNEPLAPTFDLCTIVGASRIVEYSSKMPEIANGQLQETWCFNGVKQTATPISTAFAYPACCGLTNRGLTSLL